MTQNERILNYIMEHGSITTREAFDVFGITRLAARIFEIRNNMGIPIKGETITVKNKFGEKQNVTRYSL